MGEGVTQTPPQNHQADLCTDSRARAARLPIEVVRHQLMVRLTVVL
jgi:hypothetical protein